MKKFGLIVLLTFIVLSVLAGSGYTFRCDNPSCKLNGTIRTGRGKITAVISGYCNECEKIVEIIWYVNKEKEPESINNEKTEYLCPHCRNVFKKLKTINFCPRCKTTKLKIQELMWD